MILLKKIDDFNNGIELFKKIQSREMKRRRSEKISQCI